MKPSLALWAAILLALASLNNIDGLRAAAQDIPEPPRLGMRVRKTLRGQRIQSIASDAPIARKLKVGDIIRSGRAVEENIRFRMDIDNGLHDVRVALGDGQNVVLTIWRDQSRLEIELTPSDLYGELKEYTVTVPVGEYIQTEPLSERTYAAIELEQPVSVQVFYATDRKLVDGLYTGKRDLAEHPVKFGICEVSIPPDHRIGELRQVIELRTTSQAGTKL